MIDDFPEVLASAKQGDEAAIATLWRALNYRLVRFLWARVRDAAEDVASETWLSAARHLRTFEGNEVQFRAWLFTIAHRRAMDCVRRARRRPAAELDEHDAMGLPSRDDPAQAVIDGFATRSALAAVARLPDDQAEVILLRVVADLDVARVAEIVQKRPGTVRMLQHRGLQRLRVLLEDQRSDEGVTR